LISTDSAGSKIVGVAHTEPPSEPTDKVEVDATIISDSSIELIDELTEVLANTVVIYILNHDKHGDRVRAAGVEPIAFRYINKTVEDVKVCRESLDMRVLVLDVVSVLDEDKLVRPKPPKADLHENVNAQIVESKRGSGKPVGAFHNMKTLTWRKRVAGNCCHVDLLVIIESCRGALMKAEVASRSTDRKPGLAVRAQTRRKLT